MSVSWLSSHSWEDSLSHYLSHKRIYLELINNQESVHLSRNRNLHCHLRKNLSLVAIPTEMNPAYAIIYRLF
jgi:hypothetical protein